MPISSDTILMSYRLLSGASSIAKVISVALMPTTVGFDEQQAPKNTPAYDAEAR